jgi:flagellum-specific peptidoglycan hydrolase FlgJ
VLIAQGAEESWWGKHVKGNAYFGIKGKSSQGQSLDFATHEVADGASIEITDTFRAYASLDEAADDYGQFLRSNPRYASCFAYSNQPERFVDHLAAAGYATDPDYAEKLKKIIRSHELWKYDLPRENPWGLNPPRAQQGRNPWGINPLPGQRRNPFGGI